MEQQDRYNWGRFWVWFICGAIPGAILGFFVWSQLAMTGSTGAFTPGLIIILRDAMGIPGATFDNGAAGLIVVLGISSIAGCITGILSGKFSKKF